MKRYAAIGHFKENDTITSVALRSTDIKSFRTDLLGNDFVAYVVITEKKMNILKNLDLFDIFNTVKKMTTNYRKWNEISEYIYQCFDIITDRFNKA